MSARTAPGPVCAPAPGPCMELPPASAGAPPPGPVCAPLVLYRDTRSRLYSTAGSCKDSSPARGWPQRPRFPVVCVGHPVLGADGGGSGGAREGEACPFPCLSSLCGRPWVPGRRRERPCAILSPPLPAVLASSPVTQGRRLGRLGLLWSRGSWARLSLASVSSAISGGLCHRNGFPEVKIQKVQAAGKGLI